MNIVHTLFQSAEKLGDQLALVFRGETTSYNELATNVKKLANGLQDAGVKKGTHVGVMISNRPEYIYTYYAILANGATVIPLNPLFKEQEMTYILDNADAEIAIFDDTALESLQKSKANLPKLTNFIYIGEKQVEDTLDWKELAQAEPFEGAVDVEPDHLAQIIYTSGTTGLPKGAMITHSNLEFMTATALEMSELNEGERMLLVLPLFHAYAKLQGILNTFRAGATVYLEERFIPDHVLKQLAEQKITHFIGVPTMYTFFVNSPLVQKLNFDHVKSLGSGGASLPVELIEKIKQVFGVKVAEGYGQTESTFMLSRTSLDGSTKPGSVGKPIPGIELIIVDKSGNEVGVNEVGEIIFRGPNAMKGYYKKEEETASTIKDGWVYTGDLGRFDEDGDLYIVDRKKDMIIRGGYNVYPREIEELLYKHPAVVEVAVIGVPDEVFGEEIAAYIVTKADVTEEEIVEYCKGNLVHYKVPRIVNFVEQLPKSETGKILKNQIKESLK